jgi:tetratricopeptide (TPR) repeat protein
LLLVALLALTSACAHRIPGSIPKPPAALALRLTEIAQEGDAARRASIQLTLAGLDADIDGRPNRAMGQYLRAIQVDPNNPYAYLAIARQHASGTDPAAALPFLDKSSALLAAHGDDPRVEAHLRGLRGQSLHAAGNVHAALPYLAEAQQLAPNVWNDGRLEARELR